MDIESFYIKCSKENLTKSEWSDFIKYIYEVRDYKTDLWPSDLSKIISYLTKIIKIMDKNNVYKEYITTASDILYDLYKISYFCIKYNHESFRISIFARNYRPSGPIMLTDALFSGYNSPNHHSFNNYNEGIGNDIIQIVNLVPSSLKCDSGSIRNFSNMSPLVVACFNPSIPLEIVDFLIKSGADINHPHLLDLDNLLQTNNKDRVNNIKEIFSKYRK